MHRASSKASSIGLNLLIALAITLVVNFSYLLLLMVDKKNDPRPFNGPRVEIPHQGVLAVTPDGHGYIVYAQGAIDSVYVTQSRIRRLGLLDGDRLVVDATPPEKPGAHYMMVGIELRNGTEFDYGAVLNRSSTGMATLYQLLYYLILAFILLWTVTGGGHFSVRCLWCVFAAVGLYVVAPTFDWHTGRLVMSFSIGKFLDFILMLKCSFTLVVVILYGWIFRLSSQRQAVKVENERLKNENLITRYNMLVSQVNPHFFFNSLNSLAMLVREKQDDKALTYIDQLSYTFRYILQNGQSTLVALSEELTFAEAYAYLFRIRYADKLFFDIVVDDRYRSWTLPALTLQPLIDNAVKHNAITRSNPLRVSIRIEDNRLVVSNLKSPKLEAEPGTGIGLDNLRSRWELITGCEVEVVDTPQEFTVRLPLQKPNSK